ncbi:MAG: PQQ-binding-like beta-propeller repeat protein [Actinobacteria bacterium]|nr:PQQ-binding-like beta-propeller repeat protein [Actinomycetota bacterium]
MHCGDCGASAERTSRFCGNCGARLEARERARSSDRTGGDPAGPADPIPLRLPREHDRPVRLIAEEAPTGDHRRVALLMLALVSVALAVILITTPDLTVRLAGEPTDDGIEVGTSDQVGDLEGIDPDVGPRRMLPPHGVVFARQLWDVSGVSGTTPLVVDDVTYAVTVDGEVLAIEVGNGEVRWRGPAGAVAPGSTLVEGGDLLVAADLAGRVDGLRSEDGTPVWSLELPLLTAPTVTGSELHIILGQRSDEFGPSAVLAVLDAATGEELRRIDLGSGGAIHPPVVAGELLVVCLADGEVQARDRATLELVWQHEVMGAPACAADQDGDFVVVASRFGDVVAFGHEGELRWQQVLEGSIAEPPTLSQGGVYVVSGSLLFGFDAATGEILWRSDGVGDPQGMPASNSRAVFVATTTGQVYANYLHTGAVRWMWDAGAPVSSGIAIAHDAAVVVLPDDRLVAVGVWRPAPPSPDPVPSETSLLPTEPPTLSGEV